MPNGYIYVLSAICYAIISLSVFLYARKAMWKINEVPLVFSAVFPLINAVVIYYLSVVHTYVSDMYIAFSFLLLIEMLFIMKYDKEITAFGIVHVSLHVVCTRNFSVCLIAIINEIPLSEVLSNNRLRFISLLVSVILFFICFTFFIAFVSDANLRVFLQHKKKLRFVYILGFLLLCYQIFCAKALYYNIKAFWFVFLQLLGSVIILLGYYFMFSSSLRSSIWITQIWKNELLERQLNRQLTHYKAFERSEETVRIFKHDFKKLTAGVSALLAAGQNDKALALLEQMDHALQNNVKVHLRYSSNFLIDAILQELANECEVLNITFNASVYPPKLFPLTALECSAMFSSMAKVALGACKYSHENKKSIRINTSSAENWFTIIANFSCAEKYRYEQQLLKIQRSLEYIDACCTAEKYGGFVNLTADKINAKLTIHLSFTEEEGKADG